jgi:hypothetical protein
VHSLRRYYYDTYVFSHYFHHPEESGDYSLLNNQIDRRISLLVVEEFLQNVQRGKDNEGEEKTFLQVWEDFESILGYFEQSEIKFDNVRDRLYDILNKIQISKIDLKEEYSVKHTAPDMMDWMHIIVADLSECNEFLTTDTKFDIFHRIKEPIEFEYLSCITFIDRNTMKAVDKTIYLKAKY